MSDRSKAKSWGRAGAVLAPAAVGLDAFLKAIPANQRKETARKILTDKGVRKAVLKNAPTIAALAGTGYLLGRLAHYILRGPSYEYATANEEMYEKVAFNFSHPPAPQFSFPSAPSGGGGIPNKTMMERDAMISVLGQAMSGERDPMRKRRLYELARTELGPYAMPLRKNMMISAR